MVLNDISKGIDSSYYGDILKALEDLITYGTNKKVSQYTTLKNVWKIRVNDVRLAFTRISDDVYVILGVFCKKDQKGSIIVRTLRSRSKAFQKDRKNILNAMKISEYHEEILTLNKEIGDAIKNLINGKVKNA